MRENVPREGGEMKRKENSSAHSCLQLGRKFFTEDYYRTRNWIQEISGPIGGKEKRPDIVYQAAEC